MMNHQWKPKTLISFILFFLSLLGCNLLNTFQQNLEGVKSTVVEIATQAKGGSEVIATGQAIATQLANSQLDKTVMALATEVSQSGAIETLQALTTQQAPGISETLQAVLTQVPPIAPLAPNDIPIIESQKENLVITNSVITYQVTMPTSEVISFYKAEMPNNGWTYQPSSSQELQNFALLNYTKENRMATVTINLNPANQKTIVTINLQNP
ncbi:MAG: hypothetical protein N3D16_09685 [Anaerolineales bacterium]|nr:hypothetical protein [Anaerolineales bacterium]